MLLSSESKAIPIYTLAFLSFSFAEAAIMKKEIIELFDEG